MGLFCRLTAAAFLLLIPVRAGASDAARVAASTKSFDVTQVSSITIHSGVGGLGRGSVDDVAITRRDGAFIRNDGTHIPSSRVSALLDAIAAPRVASIAQADPWFVRTSLMARMQDAETVYLGSAMRLPRVRAEFEQRYEDVGAFEAWLEPRFAGFMNDYYPALEATVVVGDRHISVSSRSQWPFMLPIAVDDAGGTRRTYDPALSAAIGALMPNDAATCHLLGCTTYDLWASHIVDEPALAAPISQAAATPSDVRSIAARFGLSVSYDGKEQDRYRNAYAWFSQMPQIRADFLMRWNFEAADYLRMLSGVHHALTAAVSSRWFVQHVVLGQHARVELSELSIVDARQPDFRSDEIRGLRKSGFYHAAACFEHDRLMHDYGVDVALPRDAKADWWLLLENGDLILDEAAPGESIPEGSIVRTDGSVELPTSSLPC